MRVNKLGMIACLLVVCMLLPVFTSCETEPKENMIISNRIQDFVVKCNTLDLDGILRCLDPEISEPIATAISGIEIISGMAGKEVTKEDMLDTVTNFLLSERGLDATEFFESIEVEVLSVMFDETATNAIVNCNIFYAISDINFARQGVVYLRREIDTWYISGLRFNQSQESSEGVNDEQR